MKVDLDDVRSIHETTLTIRGARRRTTVPAEIVDLMGLVNGDKLRWIAMKNGAFFVMKTD